MLYLGASHCWVAGRIEAAVHYCDAGQKAMRSGHDRVPYGAMAWFGGAYVANGEPRRWEEFCRSEIAAGRDTHTFIKASLVMALTITESHDEAMAAAAGLIEAAEAAGNPCALSYALLAYGFAYYDAKPIRALDAVRRGLLLAQDSGNRGGETHLALSLCRLEAEHGDPLQALEYSMLAIRSYHDSGNTTQVHTALALLAALFDRLGRHEPAATIAGFSFSPLTAVWIPELDTAIAHLRGVLGDQTYESLARKGELMTTAAMAAYAYDQICQARAGLLGSV
jgi:tetratricopeptide (TPR) repeat protein